ncbi:unnamed protein product, partial [Amoebophrya sp. A25]
ASTCCSIVPCSGASFARSFACCSSAATSLVTSFLTCPIGVVKYSSSRPHGIMYMPMVSTIFLVPWS